MANIPTDIPMRRGMLFVLSSPSGAGKTTLARKLLEQEDNLFMSVSATTRTPRPSEEEGKDYIFVDQEAFQNMIKDGALLE
ncbi:MAG TPA: guanylate kinase, partial [Alphaproteobacteria bacterium]|nr:guanylate kinase [Alphaproteobacteria bacterium]